MSGQGFRNPVSSRFNPVGGGAFSLDDIAAKIALEAVNLTTDTLAISYTTTAVTTAILTRVVLPLTNTYPRFAGKQVYWIVEATMDVRPQLGAANTVIGEMDISGTIQGGQILARLQTNADRVTVTRKWIFLGSASTGVTFALTAAHTGAVAYTVNATHTKLIINPLIIL